MSTINCFKAYDVRGRVPEDLNEEIAYRIGRAYAAFVRPETVAVGRDIRLTSDSITSELIRGLTDSGVTVVDIGIGGTEMVYFATFHYRLSGGIMVTASHNPPNYNGMKMVREESRPISEATGLKDIRALAEAGDFDLPERPGKVEQRDVMDDYIAHLLTYIDPSKLKPLKVVVNAGNGCAGPIIDRLEAQLPLQFIKLYHEPDGHFPNGVPNPMIEDKRIPTIDLIKQSGADIGLAWDGDFDRCFFFDETGEFIEGYYIVGLLAQSFLDKNPGSSIVHDPRLTWNTLDVVTAAGGKCVESKSGHAFIKQTMREADAIYGGEMSAHHYFRDFSYADSGMIPWLLLVELLSTNDASFSSMVRDRVARFPASGEINRKVDDANRSQQEIEAAYRDDALSTAYVDGLSMEFSDWRFNLRASNTEPLLRLNVESRGDFELMQAKTRELLDRIGGEPG
jgi:phosphomannomutase/phosphomannomutase/phosphoglucomutase